MKKIISLLLCIVLTVAALAVFSVAASARETDTPAATNDVTPKGYQNRNSGYGVRVVAQIANAENYREVGFVLSDGTKETTRAATYMFKTLLASDTEGGDTYVTLTAEEGCYLFALAIEEVAAEGELTLVFKPYAVDKNGNTLYGAEKTLVKAKNAGFTEGEAHTTHTPVHHEATAATAASYATAWNTEYWSCEGCSKLFSDAACTTVVEADAVMAPAQKDNADFVNSETNPYLLANVEDYNAFAAAVSAGDTMAGKFAKITVDLGTTEAPITAPIGTVDKYFGGTLDGDNHTVIVELNENAAVGLVSYLAGGTVKNVTVRGNVTRQTASKASYAGGIVGMITSAGGTVTNCTNRATVTAPSNCYAGGIIGHTNGVATIANCVNYGSVTAGRNVGGIIGGSGLAGAKMTITDVTNHGAVTGSANYVGGIVGYINSKGNVLTNCTNTGDVTGVNCVGGIVGLLNQNGMSATVDGATVENCTISGTQSVGGWIGRIGAKSTATYKHYTAPTGVTYKLNGAEMTATAGFDTTNRTDGAKTTTPGEAFGTCAGTATNVTE